jgi:Tol biopolymer transport system component/DNA-binding winged helix-turn-helix (wHTH) protein
MQVLECLAEQPGDVVSRDTLVARVWPGVFVTDDVLHRAIRELRRVFGDDTANPAYVETIRKRGYRLIAPVTPIRPSAAASTPASALPPEPDPASAPAPPAAPAHGTHVGPKAPPPPPHTSGTLARPWRFAAASALLALALGAAVYALALRPDTEPPAEAALSFVALTSSPLNESDPAIAPNGTRLAYAMRSLPGTSGQADIFISDGPSEAPQQLTNHPADDRLPAWSPDAATLAFVRVDGATCDVMLMTIAARRERRLAPCGNFEEPRVTWSRDGNWLVQSVAPGPDPIRGWQIARIAAATGVRELLTMPAPGTLGDHSPVVSPDGRRIAFVRAINGSTGDLHVMSFDGGSATRITWDNGDIVGLDWLPDGRALVFATDRAGGYSIWRVPLEGGEPQLVAGGAAKMKHPSVARDTGRITYESWSYEINLWQAPVSPTRIEPEGDLLSPMRPVVQLSDLWNHSPDLSPDGSRVVFVSTRSGGPELWIANADGSAPRQLTRFARAYIRQPRWSADGNRVVISAVVLGQPDLYAVDVESSSVERLTNDPDDEIAPSWSRDGQSVLFGARINGTWQIMRMDAAPARAASTDASASSSAGGSTTAAAARSRVQVTTDGGYAAHESPDGGSLLFTRLDQRGLWSMPIAGGPATVLVPEMRAAEIANWRVTPHGVYFVGLTGDHVVIRRAALTGGPAIDVAAIENYSWPGFAVTPDGAGVVFARWDRRESNILAIDTR